MPAATPLPSSPSVLILGDVSGLLAGPGCPACRYTAAARDRYLTWFALEAHADPVTITRLCMSWGMCSPHTRALMSQPGAATRLTALYRYLLIAAQQQLGSRSAHPGPCPACAHDNAATELAVEVLLDSLADAAVKDRYRETGGLCVPHLRAAVTQGSRRRVAWLIQATVHRAADSPPSLDWLAGALDSDAGIRAVLRAALPPAPLLPPGACPVCLTAARAERAALTEAVGTIDSHEPSDNRDQNAGPGLCRAHLSDAALIVTDPAKFLAAQARYQAASLSRLAAPWKQRHGWHYQARARLANCPVCYARGTAATQGLLRCQSLHQLGAVHQSDLHLLCVRDVLALRAVDLPAGRVATRLAIERADALVAELGEAFRKGTWVGRHEILGGEATAWRRAAAFLDGSVFGGCPPVGAETRAPPRPLHPGDAAPSAGKEHHDS